MGKSRKKFGPDPVDRIVGENIRMLRVASKMSQTELGEASNITFQQVQKYEKGSNRVSASRLAEFSRVLRVPLTDFFNGVDGIGVTDIGDQPGRSVLTDYAAFLATPTGYAMTEAFAKIKKPEVARRIIMLIRAMSGDMNEAISPRS